MMKSLGILILILSAGFVAKADEFPQACIRFSLDESFSRIPVGAKSDFFVKCSTEKAEPQRSQPRPRYSEYEVKELHQAFVAITDCLDIEPQSIFPKLMMESGFHVQIQSPGGDAGIGQLTSKAIGDVDRSLPAYKKMIYESVKPSCRWIRTKTQSRSSFWQPSLGKSKCAVMAKPNNPIKNLLYTAIFHKLNQGYVNNKFEEKNIAGLLRDAGYQGTDYTALKRMLVALGYNTGGSTAVRNLQDFLFSRIDFIERKKMEFNVDPENVGFITPADFDFTVGLQGFNARKAVLKTALQISNPKLTDLELDAGVQRLLRNTSVSQYTFPEWLKVWQSHGGPGYVSSLVGFSLRLDQKFGAGTCSNASSFQLSGH